MNPFEMSEHDETAGIKSRPFTFSRMIEVQIVHLTPGDAKKLSLSGAAHSKARTAVHKLSVMHCMKFSCKADESGDLWVMRVK